MMGESLPVERKAWRGALFWLDHPSGEIGALVYATGANTYFGKTAQLVQEAHTVSHFQKQC